MTSKSIINRRLKPSDPIKLSCNCDPEQGLVILFYSYLSINNPEEIVEQNKLIINELKLTGKVRIGKEGVNITVAGEKHSIERYVDYWCQFFSNHTIDAPSINHLVDESEHQGCVEPIELQKLFFSTSSPFNWTNFKTKFFKPTPGCCHVFDSPSIKLIDEICPLGIESNRWNPKLDWGPNDNSDELWREKLNPEQFHEYLSNTSQDSDVILLDVRNYYESKIGKFDDAWCPPIRSFKGLPSYLKDHQDKLEGKTLLTYCTGGIRCEKATAYIRDFIQPELVSKHGSGIKTVKMLEGGIHNYLEWCKANSIQDTKWKGRNYVFDARQSTNLDSYSIHSDNSDNSKLETATNQNDAKNVNNLSFGVCTLCHKEQYHFIKCHAPQCHLILIRCPETCDKVNPYCCLDCEQFDLRCQIDEKLLTKPKDVCSCEVLRRQLLKKC